MKDNEWDNLLSVIDGKVMTPLPVGFYYDSTWIPFKANIDMLDYYMDDELWFNINLDICEEFKDAMFFPGFFSEYGMCSEPSAFGARCSFPQNDFPFPKKCIYTVDQIDHIQTPNPVTDGLGPLMLNRLKRKQEKIQNAGHKIRFSVSRGPLNIASFLMGTTEFFTEMVVNSNQIHKLLETITDYLIQWHKLQMQTFDTIDGMYVLDDLIGFIGEEHFKEFCYPYYKELYNFDVSVKFLHNDADCRVSAPYLPDWGVNLFNMGFSIPLNELQTLTKNKVTLLGNVPPRDVVELGTPRQVKAAVHSLIDSLENKSRIILSMGGGIPPKVKNENLHAFIQAAKERT